MTLSEADLLFQASLVHHQAGRFDEAIAGYTQVLGLAPGHAPAKAMLASITSREPPRSIASPRTADDFLTDGSELIQTRRYGRAAEQFRKGLAVEPDRVELILALADTLVREISHDDDETFSQAETQPDSFAVLNRLGQNLPRHRKMLAEAVTLCRRAIELAPDLARAYASLGDALALREDTAEEVLDVFRRALALEPDNEIYRYRVSLLSGLKLETLAPAVVANIFDAAARQFDVELARLKYTVPQRMRDAVGASAGRVADLGCGTGLCGPLFREGASRLVGVDVSPGMLALARERGVYDELLQADLHEFLAGQSAGLDLILSADVVIYVGNLDRLIPLAAAALAPGGRLAFSTEKERGPDPYRFQPIGRFSHSESYIRRLARESGLLVDQCLEIPVRLSGESFVPGQLFVLRRA